MIDHLIAMIAVIEIPHLLIFTSLSLSLLPLRNLVLSINDSLIYLPNLIQPGLSLFSYCPTYQSHVSSIPIIIKHLDSENSSTE